MRSPIRLAVCVLASIVLVVGVAAALLIYPGTPGGARSLRFQGYVALPESGGLSVLDYLSVSDRHLFVTSESSGAVYEINLRGGAAPVAGDIAVFSGKPATHGVVIDPAGGLAFVTRSGANTVDLFDPATMRLVKRIPVADDPDGIFYDPAEKLVYAASGDSRTATVIDPATREKLGAIVLGGIPEYAAFDEQTKLLYQNLRDTNSVVAIDLAKRAVVQRWTLGQCHGPTGMALDGAGRRLFVVCSGNARLVIFDLNTDLVTISLPIGGAPDSVAFDSGLRRIYTTGVAGVLSVFQQDSPDSYRRLDQINLHLGAHTLAIDPDTHELYVGYAGLIVPPRLAVFRPVPS